MIQVIQAIKQAVNIPVIPLSSDKIQEQIIYTPTPLSDNGIIYSYQLRLNIVANTLANAESYDKAIRDVLLNFGDSNDLDNVLDISVNGGGTLTSTVGVHRIINLIIKERK